MNPGDFLSPGLSLTETHIVLEEHSAAHLGSGTVKVFATPSMILFMEIAARKLLDAHLPAGYSSVGVHVDVYHRAPARLGSEITVTVTVETVAGNHVHLAVQVLQGDIVIGEGRHERYVIDVERFLKRDSGA